MKSYWSIPGLKNAPWGEPCIAFYKYDGSNLRFEWNKKGGWNKFGTRRRLFDERDKEYGISIPYFQDHFAESLERVFTDNKEYRGVQRVTAFFEFFGDSSFAGWHDPNEQKRLVLIDVELYKKGFVLPRNFVKDFACVPAAEVVYDGPFDREFVHKVQEGHYNVGEGVVAKGTITGKRNNPQHGLWMHKVKTDAWLQRLKQFAIDEAARRQLQQYEAADFAKVLTDNEQEQTG